MSIPRLLHAMCAELTDADLNAIRKARGFSAKETASHSSFASFYVTSVGVAENMAALTPIETFTLRLLHETGEVDIEFFARLYPAGHKYGTYTQRYKPVFDEVKKKISSGADWLSWPKSKCAAIPSSWNAGATPCRLNLRPTCRPCPLFKTTRPASKTKSPCAANCSNWSVAARPSPMTRSPSK